MSVRRKTAEAFRRHGPGNARKVAEYLRDHHNATRGTIWYEAAEALEQLAKPPDPARTWARSKIVARLKARVAELEAAAREKPTAPDPSLVRSLEAVASQALDVANDYGPDADHVMQALVDELHRAGLFDAEEGRIVPAGEALQLRVARRGSAPEPAAAVPHRPDPSPAETAEADAHDVIGPEAIDVLASGTCPASSPLRVYVAGGSSEVELVARYVAALRAAGVEITEDWSAAVLGWRSLGSPPLTAAQRAAHARADLEGIERADVVWWILPDALSEGSAFEAGYALGRAKRSVVSGAWAEHGRVFPSLLAELWSTHETALAAIVSLAAERRKGGAP